MKEHVYFVYMLSRRRNGTLLRAFLHVNDMMAYLAMMAVVC